MSRLKRITLADFIDLIEFAQQTHYAKEESIPKINASEINKLESCLNTPFQQFMGIPFYRGFVNKAAVLFYLLIKNHPLSNGNKRMACLAVAWFCNINGYELQIPQFQYKELAENVAKSTEEMGVVLIGIKLRMARYIVKSRKKQLKG